MHCNGVSGFRKWREFSVQGLHDASKGCVCFLLNFGNKILLQSHERDDLKIIQTRVYA